MSRRSQFYKGEWFSETDINPGRILRVYSEKDSRNFEKRWIEAFCKDKQGANLKAYKWHIFSFEKYPAVSGEAAKEAYVQHQAPEYIVLSNEDEPALATDRRPDTCNLSDYYVFPPNLAWTMAFTHEDGWLGPYFAKHRNYQKLNTENERILQQAAQKQAEIANAKKNGWM